MVDSSAKICLIAGLGNPGREYEGTRHNAGFSVIGKVLELLPGSFEETGICSSRLYSGRFRGRNLYLMKPQTFMNLSGDAIAPFMRRSKLAPSELLLVYDDMDLPLGRLRIRRGGSAGGHHGVESTIAALGESGFVRLRVGIGHGGNTVDHVLSPFGEAELPVWNLVLETAAKAVIEILSAGAERAMNKYNATDAAAAVAALSGKEMSK